MSADLQLLRRYHDHGDAFAFRDLVRTHADMVFATARRVTQDAALAEDVAQDTFLDLARQAPRVTQSVSAWLHQVAWRRACNVVRAQVTQRRHEQQAALTLHAAQEATWIEMEPHVDAALEELPGQLRSVLIEHFLAGRTQQEIAAKTGVSQSTVSRLLDKGLRELRVNLERKGVLSGAGLAVFLSAQTAQAAPQSLTISLGKLSLSSPITTTTTGAALLAMNITKIVLATAATAALIGVPLALHHHQKSAATKLPSPAPVPAERAMAKAATRTHESKHFRPTPVSASDQQKVDAIIRRHKGMSKEQLKRSAELNKLMDRFLAMLDTPEMNEKMEQRLTVIKAAKPMEHGIIRMDFGILEDAHSRAWLEAIVSNDTQRMQDWILNTLDGAVFEFAFDPDLERTSNGVSVQPGAPSKADLFGKDGE
jgi:RNA polymerase sigma factor (sigma-70 family)